MESVPKTRYTKAEDGTHLAYQIVGDGSLDLLLFAPSWLPMEALWEEPSHARCLRRLSSFSRLLLFDRRGVGLSDPAAAGANWMESAAVDAVAVLDAAQSQQAAVFGVQLRGRSAILLAATKPDRVSSLVLANVTARVRWAPDYTFGLDDAAFERYTEATLSAWRDDARVDDPVPFPPSSDAGFVDWLARWNRRGASPAQAQATVASEGDVRSVLSTIRVPTLVLHRPAPAHWYRPEFARYLAEHIVGARYVEVPGEDFFVFLGDSDALLDEVEEFLTGTRQGPSATDRILATVLFTDIVDSTQLAMAMGDRAWRDRLHAHDTMVRRQLARFRGREVKTMGDGFLATFDGPARAIQCGCAIRDGARQLGVAVRVGLHTGEIELRGDDIGGVTVNIGSRVAAQAGANEVLVSRTVTDLVAGSDITFEDRGEHELKGVRGSWRLFGVNT